MPEVPVEITVPDSFNLSTYILEENIQKGRGENAALYYRKETYSFNDLSRLTNRVGNILRQFDVGFEDRVLLVLQDSPLWIASWFAAMKVGGVATHAYTYLTHDDYRYFIEYVRPRVVIADADTIAKVRVGAKSANYKRAILVSGVPENSLEKNEYALEAMIEKADDRLEAAQTSKNDMAFWNFSGGTTGKPKGVPHMHHDIVYGFESFNQIVGYTEKDIVLRVPKLFFHYARDLGMNWPLKAGAAVALFPERSTASVVFDMIARYRPTILLNVPTMMRSMLQTPRSEWPDMSCLRLCIASGEPLSADLYKDFTREFGVEVINSVGSAETYVGYIVDRPGQVVPGAAGKGTPLVDVRLVDGNGKDVEKGETGVLWVRSEASGWCYHQDHEKTKKTFLGNDWINTNDLFTLDENEYYWYKGRADDLIKVSGVYVSPMEIEKCLESHESVRECVVMGLKDKDGLLKTKAFISLKSGFLPSEELADQIQRFCREKMASYKAPRTIEFFDELPKTGQGKIDKRQLREKGL